MAFVHMTEANTRTVRLRQILFLGDEKQRKKQHYKKQKQIRCFNIISIAEYWCEIGCTSEGSVNNQSWNTQFPIVKFSQMALFGSCTLYHVSATCKKVGHM